MSLTSPLLEADNDEDIEVDSHHFNNEILPTAEVAEGEEENVERNISDIEVAKAYAMITAVRGVIIMTYVFFFAALLSLAEEAAGCDADGDDDCSEEIYGIRPSSTITIISTFSGLISCFFAPIIGAITDFTPYRKALGITTAIFLTLLQVVLIGTVEGTWIAMSVIFAISSFVYQAQSIACFSFLPDIARLVDERTMATFSSKFSIIQFVSMLLFVLAVTGISAGFGLDEVETAHVSQSMGVVCLGIGFSAWRKMPFVPAKNKIPPGKSIISAGFSQNWKTLKGINSHYGDGLRWFLLANTFGYAGTGAISVLSITFLKDELKMNSVELGITFTLSLLFSIPGAKISSYISKKTNPVVSLKVELVFFSIVTIIGGFIVDREERKNLGYLLGGLWGVCLGWFYPTANLIFSLLLPKGQESELTGFYFYSGEILVWMPPLCFTLMNENDIPMKWGLMSVTFFFACSFSFLCLMSPWKELRKKANENSKMIELLLDENE